MGSPLRWLSLCSGIGGMDLGIQRATARLGLRSRVVCYVEREAPVAAVLVEAMRRGDLDAAPVWLGGVERLGDVPDHPNAICAGFPCQPFSSAARGRNVAFDLWPAVADVVAWVRPRVVFLENVQRRAVVTASHDLHGMGYRGGIARVSASQVGAPHQRRRWFLLAHADGDGQRNESVDAEVAGAPTVARPDWWAEPFDQVVDVVHGLPERLALAALGNSCIPDQAAAAFAHLWRRAHGVPR